MNDEAKSSKVAKPPVADEPDYDDLPRGEFNPIWEVAIALGLLLAALGVIVALA
jgi:hypothetical protein